MQIRVGKIYFGFIFTYIAVLSPNLFIDFDKCTAAFTCHVCTLERLPLVFAVQPRRP